MFNNTKGWLISKSEDVRPLRIRTRMWRYNIKTDDVLWVCMTQDKDQQGITLDNDQLNAYIF